MALCERIGRRVVPATARLRPLGHLALRAGERGLERLLLRSNGRIRLLALLRHALREALGLGGLALERGDCARLCAVEHRLGAPELLVALGDKAGCSLAHAHHFRLGRPVMGLGRGDERAALLIERVVELRERRGGIREQCARLIAEVAAPRLLPLRLVCCLGERRVQGGRVAIRRLERREKPLGLVAELVLGLAPHREHVVGRLQLNFLGVELVRQPCRLGLL